MKRIIKIALVVVISFLFSCKGKQMKIEGEEEVSREIKIDKYEHRTIDLNSFIANVDTVSLFMDDYLIAPIKDVAMNDSIIYILDNMKSISAFSTFTGNILGYWKKEGLGPGEYIAPQAIVFDNEMLYVLDLHGQCVLSYDYDFNFNKKITIGFPAMDFISVSDGFLFYNLNPMGDFKEIVHTDMDGNVLNSFSLQNTENDIVLSERIFEKDDKGDVYIMPPMSNKIFIWDNDAVNETFILNFGNKQPKADKNSEILEEAKEVVIRSFVTSKYVITLFESNKKVYTNVFDREKNISQTGLVNTNMNTAFFPSSSYRNSLVGIYEQYIDVEESMDYNCLFVRYNFKE